MKGIPQGRYTKEFREEAVKLVTEEKLSWAEAARRLYIPVSTIGNWMKASKAGKLGNIGKTYRPLTEIEVEFARMKKENATLKMENEILKKPPRILRRSRCQVRANEGYAAQVSGTPIEPAAGCFLKRLLCLAR
jgi:transposase-like protein